jgi:hypothetical protein
MGSSLLIYLSLSDKWMASDPIIFYAHDACTPLPLAHKMIPSFFYAHACGFSRSPSRLAPRDERLALVAWVIDLFFLLVKYIAFKSIYIVSTNGVLASS